MAPDRTFFSRRDFAEEEALQECLTVLVSSSVPGKKGLLIIGKSNLPNCFRGVLNLQLSVPIRVMDGR